MQIFKQLVTVSMFLFLSKGMLFAQTAGINYQALILNSEVIQIPGADIEQNQIPLGLEDVSFRFSITNEAYLDLYIEEQTTTTDQNGMVSLIVGDGTPLFSTFDALVWNGTLKYLNVEIDIHSQNQGYVFLDIQKILYLPQSGMGATIDIIDSTSNIPTTDNEIGDIVWVSDVDGFGLPSLMVWDGSQWQLAQMDYDPTNEFALVVVLDDLDRDLQFATPVAGDQVWNQACDCIQVYDGANWRTAVFSATTDMTTIEGIGTTLDPFKVKDLGIITAKLADDSVTTAKIADLNVTTTKLADDAVTTAKILDTNVTTTKLADDAVTTAKILDANVTTAKLADDAVTTAKILDANVTTTKLADDAVTTVKITDANVTTAKIASGGNDKVLVTDGTGTVAWIDKSSLTAVADLTTIEGTGTTLDPFKVKDLGITTAKIADDAVTTVKLLDANVTTTKLADDAVTTAKIADANVTTTKIAAGTNNQRLVTDGTGAVSWANESFLGNKTIHHNAITALAITEALHNNADIHVENTGNLSITNTDISDATNFYITNTTAANRTLSFTGFTGVYLRNGGAILDLSGGLTLKANTRYLAHITNNSGNFYFNANEAGGSVDSVPLWNSNTNGGSYATNDIINYNGVLYRNLTGTNLDTLPTADAVNWVTIGGGDSVPLWNSNTNGGSYAANDIINYNGVLYRNLTGTNLDTLPTADTTNWVQASDATVTAWASMTNGGVYAVNRLVSSNGVIYRNLTGTNTNAAPATDFTNWATIVDVDSVPLWNSNTNGGVYATNDIINYNGVLYRNLTGTNTNAAPATDFTNWATIVDVDSVPLWNSNTNGGSYATNDIINYNGVLYRNLTGTNLDTLPTADTTNWVQASDATVTAWASMTNGGAYAVNRLVSFGGSIYRNLLGANTDTNPNLDVNNWRNLDTPFASVTNELLFDDGSSTGYLYVSLVINNAWQVTRFKKDDPNDEGVATIGNNSGTTAQPNTLALCQGLTYTP